jgi:hypothetical protein
MLRKLPELGECVREARRICRECGRRSEEGARFCSQCGKKLKSRIACVRCRKELDDDDRLEWGYAGGILGEEDREITAEAICCLGCGKYYHRECYGDEGCPCGILF